MTQCPCGDWNPSREQLDVMAGILRLPEGTPGEDVRKEFAASIRRDRASWGSAGDGNPLDAIMGPVAFPRESAIVIWALCDR